MAFFNIFKKKSKKESITLAPVGELPKFKYHPDPIKTGSIKKSEYICESCGRKTGYIYTGPVFSEEELEECICPWCIADGSAHEKFDAEFTDFEAVGDYGNWEKVSNKIKEEIAYKTPGFSGWQQERWWTHCGDAAVFLGRAGNKELKLLGPEAIEVIKYSTGLEDGSEWEKFFSALDKNGSPTAYIFKCHKCGKLGGYQDCD